LVIKLLNKKTGMPEIQQGCALRRKRPQKIRNALLGITAVCMLKIQEKYKSF
jgi:hypothetical protein